VGFKPAISASERSQIHALDLSNMSNIINVLQTVISLMILCYTRKKFG
jgi:hypothetical protein